MTGNINFQTKQNEIIGPTHKQRSRSKANGSYKPSLHGTKRNSSYGNVDFECSFLIIRYRLMFSEGCSYFKNGSVVNEFQA